MKKSLLVLLSLIALNFSAFAQPANNNCNTAQSLGTLPTPGACVSGIQNGAPITVTGTTVGATASSPYTTILNCQGGTADQFGPSPDVWYSFVASGTTVHVTIAPGASPVLTSPNIGVWTGNCNNLTPWGCAIGTNAGNLTSTFEQTVIGQTYYIQVSSGSTTGTGNFSISVDNDIDCNNCNQVSSLTASPAPVYGAYTPGQVVHFCYTISSWVIQNTNWLHGVQITMGAGWTGTVTNTSPAATVQNIAGPGFDGAWYYSSSGLGTGFGAGFYFETTQNGTNASDNFGDNGNGPWTFCWDLTVDPGCAPGSDLSVTINTSGDGESGSWSNLGCAGDPAYIFTAMGSCCPPTMASTPTCSGLNNGTATATPIGAGTFTYSWAPGGQTTQTASNLASGTYTVTVTNTATQCAVTNTIAVAATTAPVSNAGADISICSGATGSLGAAAVAGNTYSWSPTTGLSSSTVSNPTVTLTNAGATATTTTYTVTTTNTASTCTSTDIVVVTVKPIPVSNAGSDISYCSGQTGTIGTAATTGYSYSWSPTTGLSSGTVANPTVSLTNVTTAPVSTTYTVTTTLNGCTSTDAVIVTVNPVPTSTFTQSPNQCLTGNSFTFTNTGSSGAGYTQTWNFGGATTNTSTAVSPTGITYAAAGTYTITHTVTGPGGCVSTTTSSVTVFPQPVVTVTSPTICSGQTATMTASGASTYTWSAGATSSGATATAAPTTTTSYTVTGTSVNGCTATAVATVTVNPLPVITVAPITICAGTPGTLTASGASTYSWASATGLSATTGASVTATPPSTTTYTVTGTTAAGCTATTTVTVTVNPVPVTTVTSATVCPGQTATLTASGATTYSWTAGLSSTTGTTVTGSPASTTSYTVTGTSLGCSSTAVATITIGGSIIPTVNSPTICTGQTATLTASNATTFTWTSGLSSTTGSTVTGSPTTTTSYTVTGTAGGCSGTAVATITVNPLPVVSVPPITICAGTAGTLNASGASTYSWTPSTGLSATTGSSVTANPASTTTYTVTGTSAAGCLNTTTVVVTVNPLPTIIVPPITICSGIAGTLTASGASTYVWSPSTGLSATTGSSVSANPASTSTYTVTGTSAAGCVNTASVIVTVNPLPVISVSPITICTGIAGSLTASGANTYSWSPSTGLSATTGGTVSANPAATTTYTVTGTASTGCINTTTVMVTVTPPATLSISKVNVSCFGGNNGSATVTPTGGTSPYTYAWASSGGTGATASTLTAGTYTVTVTTSNGCVSSTTTTITQPTGMTLTMSSVNATCGSANGQASVAVSGGTSPYTYSWAPSGGTAATATGLLAGSYTVTVTDANTCSSTNSVAVNNSLSPSASTTVISNVSCFGGNNGSASVSISGGTSPYSQSWSPSGGTGTTASSLTAGTYTVTVTDANGCIVTAPATITQPSLLTATTVQTDASCFGGSTGSATVTAGGGTPGYTYSWAPSGGTGTTASGLAAGTYTVTVTDSKGCTITATATIGQPSALTAVTSNTPVSCFGGNNGSTSVVAGGGTPAYSYSWAPGSNTNPTASGLTAGTYTVTVTDLNGCIKTASTSVAQPTVLNVTVTNISSTCGLANASATATVSGGTTSYSYTWSPAGGSAATASGLSAGSYTVTVTDGNGCTNTASTTINDLSGLVASITSQTNVSCFGGNNGSVTVTASGSTAPYTYSINAGTTYQISGTFGTLTAGNYTIIAKDANGCTVSVPVTITEPTALTAAITAQTNILCFSSSTGSVTVAGNNGTPTYTYSINGTTFVAGGTFSSLAAGPYTITVKDSNGCTTTVPVTITQPPVLVASITSQTNNVCFGGNTGSVTVTATGGTTAYVYSLNGGAGQSSGTFNALTAGSYTVTVTDANSCTTTVPVTITQPTQVTVSATKVDATCGAPNGSLTASGLNGTPTYTYSINGTTFQAGASFTGLAASTYTVTVKDANGCTNTTTISIVDLSGLTASITAQTNVSCNGGNNGTVTVTASGSTSPYTYSLNGAAFVGSGAFSGLTATSYTVTAKDGNGCTVTVPVTITQPPVLAGSITAQTNITCFGANNGSVTVAATGGTPTYQYSIDGGAFGSGATFNSLTPGSHSIVIKDANACTVTIPVTITQPTALTLTTSAVNAICTAANGSATVVATGGTPNYSYAWLPGNQTTPTASNITAGNYAVQVTDANGCSQTANISVGSNPGGTASISSSNNVTCNGAFNGNATVTMSAGATPPYTYAWTPSSQNTVTATNLGPGNYNVTVTDGNGCIASTSVTITEPSAITNSFSNTNVTCFGSNNGLASVNVAGGTSPYTYLWTPTNQTTQAAGGLIAGSYTVTITDANGCVHTASTAITEPVAMELTETHVDANCNLSNGSATVSVSGGVGPYTYSWSSMPVQTTATATGLAANTYVATVTDANTCSQNISVTINNLAGPVASIFSSTNVSCNGLSDGNATVTISGGTAPYTYAWTPSGGTLPTASNLAAGTYTLNATDVNGCAASTSVTITEPAILATTYTSTNPLCFGSFNGTITSSTTGGTAPYSYLWSPGSANTSSVNNLAAGNYMLQVTDAHGCLTVTNVTLTNPPALTASTTVTDVTCNGMCNGTATMNITNATGPINYTWNDVNAQVTPTATALCAGSYSVTATDAKGCIVTASAVISTPGSLSVNIVALGHVSCYGACDGYATAAVTGGTAPFSYMWAPSGTAGSSVNNLCAANYTVTVTDANGCSATTTVLITQPNPLIATITNTDVTCFGACDAQATAVYTGGTGPYTFQWTNFATTPTITQVCAGILNLQVTDSKGCTANSSVVVEEPTILEVTTTTTNSNCGVANGTACAAITGGSPPFIYSWNDPNLQSNSCATGLNAGVYQISITDSHNCSVTNVANVNDDNAPVVTIPLSTDVTCFGAANGSAQGSITGGIIPYTIGWTPGGQTNTFANNLSGGIYSLIVTDSVGCTGSASVTINEPAQLMSGIISVTNTTCNLACDGSATVLAGGGTGPYTYLWNDVNTQTTPTATGLCAQSYSVTVTDANGCSASSVAVITEPTAIAVNVVSTTNVLCNGGNNGAITISATGGTPGYTYSWSPSVGASASVTNLIAGTYQVTVTDMRGCSKTISIVITEPTPLVLTPNSNFSTCGNSNGSAGVSVLGGTTPYSYAWSPAGSGTGTTAIITNIPAGTYNVTVTDGNGCTATASSVVADSAGPTVTTVFTQPSCYELSNGTATAVVTGGQPSYTYVWNTSPQQITQTASALHAGVYQVIVTDQNSCTVTQTVIVTQPAPLQVLVAPRDTICIGQLSQIYAAGSGGTPPYSYSWNPSSLGNTAGPFIVTPTTTTSYTVTAVDTNSCISPSQVVTVFVNPQITVTATDVSVCDGNAVTISASASGGAGAPYTYTWSNGPTGSSQSVSPTGATSIDYTVTANDNNCSIAVTDVATVTINPQAVGFMTVTDDEGCEDFTTTFNGLSNIGQTYSWNFGDNTGVINGQNITHTFTDAGTYDVSLTVTTALGCVSTISNLDYIQVNPAPTAGFTSTPVPATLADPTVTFIDQSIGANDWEWDFIYTNPLVSIYTDTIQNPTFVYPDTGIYVVQQVVFNSFGCTDTAYNTVEIVPEYILYAPNAFTPLNHDGINDFFMVKGIGIDPDNFEMLIFDRWGNEIFKTTDLAKGWDGRANGGKNVAQIDVYVWKVKAKDYRGDEHSYTGTVTIVK